MPGRSGSFLGRKIPETVETHPPPHPSLTCPVDASAGEAHSPSSNHSPFPKNSCPSCIPGSMWCIHHHSQVQRWWQCCPNSPRNWENLRFSPDSSPHHSTANTKLGPVCSDPWTASREEWLSGSSITHQLAFILKDRRVLSGKPS